MATTISQRITLDGGDDIKKQLEAIGVAGEKSFKQIQDAAQKSQIDPARFQQTKQAVDALATTGSQLANQFLKLAQAASAFGTQGAQATAQVTTGLNQTNAAAQGAGTSLLSAATAFKLAAAAIVVGIGAVIKGLTTGTGETAKEIDDQAGKLKISVAQWLELRKAIVAVDGSNDDFVKSAGTAVKIIGDAQKELLQLSKTYTVASDAGDGTTKTVTVTTGSMSSLTAATAKTITELRNFGVSAKALQSASPLAALRELATIIDRMPEGADKAAAGVKYLGNSWRDTIKVLSDAKKAVVEIDPLKASRELSADQVKAAKEATDAWKELGTAIRATKDQIGALFSEGSKAKADWLTSLVDQSRELFKQWVGLSAQGKELFIRGLGDSAAETAFKVLVAVSQQLAGIWTDVLVPAGEQLTAIVDEVAGNFAGISKSQVVAFFITIAVAVLALTIALKGIGIVLTPVTALISLFATFGPIMIPLVALVVLFWDQIKEGAASAAALVPNSLRQIQQAFGLLFKGDFAGFWEAFSTAAVAAFQTITKAAMDTPWIKNLVDGFKTIGEQIPGTLQLIGQSLISLGRAATGVANIFNKLFGTELTGTDVAAIIIIGQLTGGLQALAAIAVIANAGLSILVSTVALLGPAVGAAVAVAAGALGISVGLLTLIIGGVIGLLALLIVYWPQIKQAGIDAGNGIAAKWQELKALFNDWVTTPVANAWQWIVGRLGRHCVRGSAPRLRRASN